MARNATVSLLSIWKDKSVLQKTKVQLLWSLVFPIAVYGCEAWAMKEADRKRIEAFELWAYRRLLRIKWTEMKSNKYVLEKIKPNCRLLQHVDRLKLRYFGHVVRAKGMEYDILTGAMNGKRRRGRQRTRITDGVVQLTGLPLIGAVRRAMDRQCWRRIVHDATASRTS